VTWLNRHPFLVTCFGLAVSAGALLAIAIAFGFADFRHVWSHVHPEWLALSVSAGMLSIPCYVVAYRAMAALGHGPHLPWRLANRMVLAGFGPSAIRSGFALDRRALLAIGTERQEATVRIVGLGVLEWALLASAAWVDSVYLLARDDKRVPGSLVWPWAIAVPVGLALALWLSAPSRLPPADRGGAGWRRRLDTCSATRATAGRRCSAGRSTGASSSAASTARCASRARACRSARRCSRTRPASR
jgi:uncharacterized membrane protein YbhN (UPF0104 family)